MRGRNTSTETRAEAHCPRDSMRRNSGPKSPIQARSILSRNRSVGPSFFDGILGQTDVQQHKNMVNKQVEIMVHVPRPSGSWTQPRTKSELPLAVEFPDINGRL
jgi:hypothetical protein